MSGSLTASMRYFMGHEREVVLIAHCPEHGLHGLRRSCYSCGGPVEQIKMVSEQSRMNVELERDKYQAALTAREEPQACTCRHPPEGMIGWDRGMVDRECSVHGHEALPERRDPQIEKVIEAVQGAREWTLLSGRPAYASPSVAPPGPELPNPGEAVRVVEAEPLERELARLRAIEALRMSPEDRDALLAEVERERKEMLDLLEEISQTYVLNMARNAEGAHLRGMTHDLLRRHGRLKDD